MANYIENNRMKLNDYKPTYNYNKTEEENYQINIPTEVIKPVNTEKMLGIFVQDAMISNGLSTFGIIKRA